MTFQIKPTDKFLVLASDGLWDELSSREVAEVALAGPAKDIPSRLIEKALLKVSARTKLSLQEIKQLEPGLRRNIHDDITVLVVELDG
jgi:pyruvate dehydrogenase phosphatase